MLFWGRLLEYVVISFFDGQEEICLKNKKEVLIGIVVVVALSIGIGFVFLHSNQANQDERFVADLMEQLDLNNETSIENTDETGIILENTTFLDDFKKIYQPQITIKVAELKDDQATLNITTPDLYSILKTAGDKNSIIQNLQLSDITKVNNKVIVEYEKTKEGYYIIESEELINAIYGNAINYFKELGLA